MQEIQNEYLIYKIEQNKCKKISLKICTNKICNYFCIKNIIMKKTILIVSIICLVLTNLTKAQITMSFQYDSTGIVMGEYDTLWNISVIIPASDFDNLDSASLTVISPDTSFTPITRLIKSNSQFQYSQDVVADGDNIVIKFYNFHTLIMYYWRITGRTTDDRDFLYQQ